MKSSKSNRPCRKPISRALCQIASVVPVGDVDVVVGKKRLRCTAKQGCEMPRHRRDQEHTRLNRSQILLEAQQGAERRPMSGNLTHCGDAIADPDGAYAERGTAVA